MSDLDRVTTADGRVLTDAETAAHAGIVKRLTWPSLHWGVEDVHPDAWPHIAAAAVAAAAPVIEAAVWNAAADFVDSQRGEDYGADLRQVRDRLRGIAAGVAMGVS